VSDVIEIRSGSEQQTREVGRILGTTLGGGEVIELCGPLGAGKTQLVKGLALGLGVPGDEPITSPSFVLIREHAGRLTLYHCDAYRLQSVEELLALGLEEMLEQAGAVVAIEWADRFSEALAADAIRIDLEHDDGSSRRLRIAWPSAARSGELAQRLRETGFDVADHQNPRK
jgi:tRNA threonylcarbamoyladenosine biosynthesis protein TsaE